MDLSDLEMSWKPFGLTLTYGDWDKLVTWYIQEYYDHNLHTMEEDKDAFKLYS